MPKAIKTRFLLWKLFFNGTISLGAAFYNLLPSFLRPNTPRTKLFGKPFLIPNGDFTAFLGVVKQIILANQYHIELAEDTDTIVDAGANMGGFSIFAARKHPKAEIYAFEPTPSTFKVLQENTKYYPNIKVFNYGLGDEEKTASIVTSDRFGENYIGTGGVPVEIKTIDGLNMRMDFLKMDTEGYEANILKGASATIKKWKPIIAMSAYHKPNDKAELPALLNGITPYDCELRHDDEEDLICRPKS